MSRTKQTTNRWTSGRRDGLLFCSSEWPTFNVGWPQDGTFNLDTISQVKAKVMDPGPHGHLDQVAYIVTWEALAYDPPPWVKPFTTPKCPSLTPTAPSLPPPLPATPTTSSLYLTLTKNAPKGKPSENPKTDKEKPKTAPPKVLLPSPDPPLIDLLSDEPPPYQGPGPEQPGEAEAAEEGPVGRPPTPEAPAPSPTTERPVGAPARFHLSRSPTPGRAERPTSVLALFGL